MAKRPQDQTIEEWYADYDAATPIKDQHRFKRKSASVSRITTARFKKQYRDGEI